MRISLIAAMTTARLIGANGALPWHKPEDLRHFRELTTGHTVLMGRKTYESVGRPLPKRRNLVLTRKGWATPPAGIERVATLQEAIDLASRAGETELFVVGGAEIYGLALPVAVTMYLTFVHVSPEPAGDTWFPEWKPEEWKRVETRRLPDLEFVRMDRIAGGMASHNHSKGL